MYLGYGNIPRIMKDIGEHTGSDGISKRADQKSRDQNVYELFRQISKQPIWCHQIMHRSLKIWGDGEAHFSHLSLCPFLKIRCGNGLSRKKWHGKTLYIWYFLPLPHCPFLKIRGSFRRFYQSPLSKIRG